MSEDLIRYDVLTQDALRGVVRKVLEEVVLTGLPGEHHFFITFDTNHQGVRLSKRMRERYPESMTIVVQHSYWDLNVTETEFELDLTFNDIRERLKIPFASIQAFFDPSVKFGLQFDPDPANETADIASEGSSEIAEIKPKENTEAPDLTEVEITEDEAKADDGPAEVVSLDAFRKKK